MFAAFTEISGRSEKWYCSPSGDSFNGPEEINSISSSQVRRGKFEWMTKEAYEIGKDRDFGVLARVAP